MLVQKKSYKKQIVLIIIFIVFMSAAVYIFVQGTKEPEVPFDTLKQTQNINAAQIINLDTNIFGEKQITELKDRSDLSYTAQYSATPYDKEKLFPPEDIYIFNPQVGKKLIVYWKNPQNSNLIRIYRSQKAGQIGEIIADKIKEETSYQDFNLENGLNYYYTVKTVNENNQESENNNQVTGIPSDNFPPKNPTGIVINTTGQEIEITWVDPPDSDFDHVRLYRSQKEGELGTLVLNEKLTEPKFIDQNIQEGATYYYTLTSVDETGNESEKSLLPASGNSTPFEPAF